jgi:hypothetical protein
MFYKQLDDVPAGEDPGSYLLRLLITEDGAPFHKYLEVCSSTSAIVCFVVNNISESVAFTFVYDVSNREGTAAADLLSPQAVVPMRIQDADFRKRARKTMYLPGLDESNELDGHLVLAAQNIANTAFQAMTVLTDAVAGGGGTPFFQLMFGKDNEEVWHDADGVHAGCWITRQKGRNSALC